MDLEEALRAIGAPPELAGTIDGGDDEEATFDDVWEACARGDHRLWLAACGGAPIERVIEAAAVAVLMAGEELRAEAVLETVELAVAGALDELPAAIASCEALAADPTSGYRDPQRPGLPHAARAAMLLAHAAQGLAEGEARREAVRLDAAQRSAALLGAGSNITLPAREGPARLAPERAAHDPAQGAFTFAVAAAAEAITECVSARLAGTEPDASARAAAERELDAIVHEALTQDLSG